MGGPFDFNPNYSTSFGQGVKLNGNLFKGRGAADFNLDESNNFKTEVDVFKKKAGFSFTNTALGKTKLFADTKGNLGANTNIDVGKNGNIYGYLNANMPSGSVTGGVGFKNDSTSVEAFYNSNPTIMANAFDIDTSAMRAGVSFKWNGNLSGG